jgi:RHS repeat-associated protein
LDSAMTPLPTLAYDANGNTLSDPSGKQYTWDFENRLTQVLNPGVGTTTFRYDPWGRRIQKSGPNGATNYLYDRNRVIEEVDNAGNVLARYTQSKGVDKPLAQLRSGTTSYYQQDGLGSVTSLSNSAGALAGTYTYDSYGKATASTGTPTNPLQYTAREFDSETMLLFNRARYFDPNAGRFLNQDPIRFAGGVNFYAYTRNNPIVRTDPSGYYSGSGVVGSIYLGPDGVWYNDGPPLPPDPSNPTCTPEQWAQSPGACAGPQGADEPDPYMPDPNKKCDQPKDKTPDEQPQDQPPDDQPPQDQPRSDRICVAWGVADWWVIGFGFGMEFAPPVAWTLHGLDAVSILAHRWVCKEWL